MKVVLRQSLPDDQKPTGPFMCVEVDHRGCVAESDFSENSGLSVSGKKLTQTQDGALTPAWNLESVTMAT